MKGLLMHVGADNSNMGTVGISNPMFEDDSFEFIPIIEGCDGTSKSGCTTMETRTYFTIPTRNSKFGKRLSDFVPSDVKDKVVHYDPDFDNFTYSDPLDEIRGRMLSKLNRGDYLFFVSSLAPFNANAYLGGNRKLIKSWQKGKMAKYLVGYFEIQSVYNVTNNSHRIKVNNVPNVEKNTLIRIKENAHSKRNRDQFTIAVGRKDRKTGLLQKAVQLTQVGGPFKPTNLAREIYGDKSFPRGFKLITETGKVKIFLNTVSSVV